MKLPNIFAGKKTKSVEFLRASGLSAFENIFDSNNVSKFSSSLYLNLGVSMIRDTVSSIPLEMYKINTKSGDVQEIYDSPYLDLFNRPNKLQTQKEFWKLSITYYLLGGEAFWYLEKADEKSLPTAKINLMPSKVEILLSADKKEIVGYNYSQETGITVKLRVDEVLHFKNVDPNNVIRGIGIVKPATQRIVTEQEAAKHQAETFKNQGRPDIAIMTEKDLTTEDIELAHSAWAKMYGSGKRNAGVFGADIKDIKVLGISPKEMDFVASMQFLREDILTSLRIPVQMITSDVNYANSKVARINYIKEACEPVLDTFIDVINNKFLADAKGAEDTFITYESTVNEDRELLLKEAKELKESGIITINEARDLMNYEPVADGDVREQGNQGLMQLSVKQKKVKAQAKNILKRRALLYRKFDVIEKGAEYMKLQEKYMSNPTRSMNSVFATKESQEKYIKAFNDNIDKKAKTFADYVAVYQQDLTKRIEQYMADFGINVNNFFDLSNEVREAKTIFIPVMKNIYSRSGQDTLDFVAGGFSKKASENFFTQEIMLQELEKRAEFFILSMLDTEYNALREILVLGLADGKGVDAIGRDIRKYFTTIGVSRAKTIARTETGRLVSNATNEAYRQSELVTGKVWLSAGDSKVRDEHKDNANAGVISTEGTFPSGEKYPGEKSINCRCALGPAV